MVAAVSGGGWEDGEYGGVETRYRLVTATERVPVGERERESVCVCV